MSAYITLGALPGQFCICSVPPSRGKQYSSEGGLLSRSNLPDDPFGTTTVTFDGVVAGSEIRVYLPDGSSGAAGTEVAGLDSCAAQQQLTWPVYAAGSPNNTVWVHIIKRGLRWMKFPYVSKIGTQSIPIFQNTDLGYNNPA